MRSPTLKPFRTMAERYAATREVTGGPLQAWLLHNRQLTDHASRARALVQHNGTICRLTRFET